MSFFRKNTILLYILILAVICFCLYYVNISSYPFMDNSETMFVTIAKDMLEYNDWANIRIRELSETNYFNFSPLFFWLTNISCTAFGKISSEIVRLPVSLVSLLFI